MMWRNLQARPYVLAMACSKAPGRGERSEAGSRIQVIYKFSLVTCFQPVWLWTVDINMIESRTLLQIFESKLEETARLFFTNSFITVDLVTLIYNIVFWGLAIPAVIYLLRVEKIENCLSSLFLVFSKANSDSHKCLGVTFFCCQVPNKTSAIY